MSLGNSLQYEYNDLKTILLQESEVVLLKENKKPVLPFLKRFYMTPSLVLSHCSPAGCADEDFKREGGRVITQLCWVDEESTGGILYSATGVSELCGIQRLAAAE